MSQVTCAEGAITFIYIARMNRVGKRIPFLLFPIVNGTFTDTGEHLSRTAPEKYIATQLLGPYCVTPCNNEKKIE